VLQRYCRCSLRGPGIDQEGAGPSWTRARWHATLLIMISPSPAIAWTALVLAGGRGSRLGGVNKAAITLGGKTALDHLFSYLPEHVPVVVAGPECPTQRRVSFRREWPIHGGPVAGIASGLEAVRTPVIALLAVDMPWAGGLVQALIAEFASCDAAALVPVDGLGVRQPLCAVVRTDALRGALGVLGDPHGRSLRDLMSLIDVRERPLQEAELHWAQDIDTPDDLAKARSTGAPFRVTAPSLVRGESTTNKQGAKPMMQTWVDAVRTELNLPADVNVDVILDVARVAAHTIERPAAPVTTFLLGSAVAGGMDLNEAAAKIQQLAATWVAPAQ
jgi:molybdopterin-guanine dinucleotide biosynthesis protein A